MRPILIFLIAVACFAGTAFGQAGAIKVTSDAVGTDCAFVDTGSLVQVYIWHTDHGGAIASQWKLDLCGLPWTHLGETIGPLVIGTTITGLSIGYGSCWSSPSYLGVANFFGTNAPPCSPIRIVADPGSLTGKIEARDCSATKIFPIGIGGWVNPDGSCDCVNPPLPVEQTTWGSLKALYQ